MKKIIEYGLVILCMVPLFFINIKTSHDWGDDFAQYIHQAKNISEGISQNETGYIFNPNNAVMGPQAYPTGFPLLLSTVVLLYGIDVPAFNLFITLFLALTCFVGFLILRLHTSFLAAFVTTLIIAYNPVFLYFKTEILSDLPFAFFSMLCIYIIHKKENIFLSLLLGLLMAFTMHIRSVGALLIIIFVVYQLFFKNNIRNFSIKQHLHTGITTGSLVLAYFIIKFSFPCNTNYPSIFETENYWHTVNDHLSYNSHHLSWMFRGYETKYYYYIGVITSSCLIAFGILGFIHFFKENKKSIINLYVVAYLFIIMSFKFSDAGMRFLYPVLFFIFLYAIVGLKKSLESLISNTKWFTITVGLLVLFSYKDGIEKIINTQDSIIDGPNTSLATEMFSYINTSTEKNCVIEFDKPRALALYTYVQSVAFDPGISKVDFTRDLHAFKPDYILICENLSPQNIKSYTQNDTSLFELIHSNESFRLYKTRH
jgi:4-amino-4-deoxy-L-arabinose transferase-like glycosyltransferase